MMSTRPAFNSARLSRRLPWERRGTSEPALSRVTTSTGSPDAMVVPGQSSGSVSRLDSTVTGESNMRVIHSSNRPRSNPGARNGAFDE
jgi:hypothetical protein